MSADDREKWDRRYEDRDRTPTTPSVAITELAELLPRRGRALDLAGGHGRHAIWLARRGLDVTVADISPVGLGLARERAEESGLRVRTACVDLEDYPRGFRSSFGKRPSPFSMRFFLPSCTAKVLPLQIEPAAYCPFFFTA